MELINGTDRLPKLEKPLYLALGNFDGVHRGHQVIIHQAAKKARECGGISAAFIFDPHPIVMLHPRRPFNQLTDVADRAEVLKELGLDYLIVEQFNTAMASLTAEQFIRFILIEKLRVKGVYIGEDYSFGHKGTGTSETMRNWGEKYNFGVQTTPTITQNGKKISSSIIRTLLLAGEVNEASELLGYYFFRQGKVVRGYGIGTEMVYPTANIVAGKRLIWPGRGVYLTAVGKINAGLNFGVTNVGSSPTFAHHDMAVETHIIDFKGLLYNRELRLYFLEKLRETKTFAGPGQLKEQISRDIEIARLKIGRHSSTCGSLPKYTGILPEL